MLLFRKIKSLEVLHNKTCHWKRRASARDYTVGCSTYDRESNRWLDQTKWNTTLPGKPKHWLPSYQAFKAAVNSIILNVVDSLCQTIYWCKQCYSQQYQAKWIWLMINKPFFANYIKFLLFFAQMCQQQFLLYFIMNFLPFFLNQTSEN